MLQMLLGGSWDLVSKVISTLIGVKSIVTLTLTLVTKSHDPLSRATGWAEAGRGFSVPTCAGSRLVCLAT